MGFPGEEMVATAIEKLSDGIIAKMNESEARREREFAYKLKELEFYKANYDKEIKSIFDGWFDLLQNSLLANNKNLTPEQQKKYKKALDEALKPDTALKLKIRTMKYGGTETGKALALFSQISFDKDAEYSKYDVTYVICVLLSTLKQEILGQEIAPLTIIKVLINDYFENADLINESRCRIEEKQAELFPEE